MSNTEQLTLLLEEAPVSHSVSQEDERAWMESLVSCTSISELYAKFARVGFSGRTCPEFYQREITHSGNCSIPWKTSGMVWRGECLMLSSSEWHSGADVSFLSDVLEGGGESAAVLFEPESVHGNIESSSKKREKLAGAARKSVNGTSAEIYCITNDTGKATVHKNMCGTLLASGGSPIITNPAFALKVRCGKHEYIKRDGKRGTADAGALVGNDCAFTIAVTQDQHIIQNVDDEWIVRRLTPKECERLQGLPDDWTKVPYRGKAADACPDGPRYKAIGNSIAVPVIRWLGERIQLVDEILNEQHKGQDETKGLKR